MNKAGGIAIGGGGGVGSGPTTSAAAAAAQKQKALMVRVETDIANIVDNFTHLVNAARINDTPVRNSQEACTMDMRASRMAQAADSLLKLVSELKQTAIFSGFASLNDHVDQRISEFTQLAEKTDNLLARIGEEAAASLKELETHYYSSAQRTTQTLEPVSCQGWSRVAPSMASKPVKGPDSFEMSCIPPEEAERETKKVEGFSKSMDANIICNNSLYQEPKTKDPIGKYSADSGYGSPRKTGLVKITENVNSDRHLDPKKKDPLSRPAGNASANQRSLPSLRTPRKSQLSTTSEAAGATASAALPANMKANEAKTFSSITNRANLSGSRSTRSNSLESSGGSNKPHTGGDVRWDAIQLATARGTIGLSNFRLLKRLGYGDIGSVYLVELRGTNGHFAMKVMDKASLASRNKILRAQTEREILGLLDHPFLPTLYTYFETDKFCCIVMEFCSGGNLHSLRQKQPNKHFTEEAARFYASEVLLALEYLHMLGVVYRDLKPENVLVRDEGHIMLSDFDLSLRCSVSPTLVKSSSVHVSNNGGGGAGILEDESAVQGCIQPSTFFPRILPGKKSRKSKSDYGLFVGGSMPELMAEPTNVRSMSFVGTHEYLAPEIIRGEGHGSAVDWWTFGIFLYELLHGATPFKGQGNRATLFNVVGQPLKFPENPQVSMAARDLIRGLLVKEPHKRIAYKRGATEIKQHPFFEGVNWALVRSALPPHVPEPVDFSQYASKEAPPADRKTPDIGGDNKNGSSPENKDESYIEFEYF